MSVERLTIFFHFVLRMFSTEPEDIPKAEAAVSSNWQVSGADVPGRCSRSITGVTATVEGS